MNAYQGKKMDHLLRSMKCLDDIRNGMTDILHSGDACILLIRARDKIAQLYTLHTMEIAKPEERG
jgi:hypothetical protein